MKRNTSSKIAILTVVQAVFISSIWAARNDYKSDIRILSEHIMDTATDLKQQTDKPVLDSSEIDFILDDLKDLIRDYENTLVFAESPYPGEILLARTPHLNDTWHEAACSTRYNGPFKEIRIRRTGSSARYLRINDIEITFDTPQGPEKQTFNKGARVQLYNGSVFNLVLPRPMRVTKIRILVEHDSNGLIITGVPYNIEIRNPRRDERTRSRQPSEALLGTTPAGKDTWLETICDNPSRPVKEIQLKRTGQRTSYIRISDIEITYRTPQGTIKQTFNQNGRIKLYYGQTYGLVLPEPRRVTRIRILVAHESTGLQVYGIY